MPGNKYNGNSTNIPTRVERLLRERELREQRKSSRASHSNEVIDNHRGAVSENGPRFREGDNSGVAFVEQYLEEAAAARALVVECERQDGRPFRQRLLVVANRLPVSAVRRGENSWSLEISVGGLVSALLGKILATWWTWFICPHFYIFHFMNLIIIDEFSRCQGVRGKVDWMGWRKCSR